MRRFRQQETRHPEDSLNVLSTARDEFRLEVERQAARLLEVAEARAREVEHEATSRADETRLRAQRELEVLTEKRAALFSHMIESVDRLEHDFADAMGNFRRELEKVAAHSEAAPTQRAMQPDAPKPRIA
jgi:hypothetical protein